MRLTRQGSCSIGLIAVIALSAVPTAAAALPADEAGMQLALANPKLPPPTCTAMRDPALQSHFMLFNLCRHEERRDALQRRRTPVRQPHPDLPPKKFLGQAGIS